MLAETALAYGLAAVLVYNNSVVVLGPGAWSGGVGPRRALVAAVLGQLTGALTSHIERLRLGVHELVYVLALYAALTAAGVSLPLSVASFALTGLRPEAAALWLASPAFALVAYLLCKLPRVCRPAPMLSLLLASYAFGYNNIALFSTDPLLTAASILAGTYLGLRFSRRILLLVGLGARDVVAINLTLAIAAAVGSALAIPVSFTLVAYSAVLAASMSHRVRIIRAGELVRAYLGIVAAMAAALIPRAAGLLPLRV
ncbi:MAG: hypothetical protein LM577_07805 [Thermoproteaceae archaeon]|nr:hypothetical protein [Thermoproteaceae archaeon]